MTPKSQAQATGRLMVPLVQRNRSEEDNELGLKHPELEVYMNTELEMPVDKQTYRFIDQEGEMRMVASRARGDCPE